MTDTLVARIVERMARRLHRDEEVKPYMLLEGRHSSPIGAGLISRRLLHENHRDGIWWGQFQTALAC